MDHKSNETNRSAGARAALVALLLFTQAGCSSTDRVTSESPNDQSNAPISSASTRPSGIPFGLSAMPVTQYGPTYTGGLMLPPSPDSLLARLATIRGAGGRVVLALAGGPLQYTNADGTFNLDLWKGRIDRYRSIDFNSSIDDGTIIGHYLIDEPNCTSCWGGQAIGQDVVEAMAQYSKSIWPTMTTIARAEATWLQGFSGQYVDLDAGWAQYVVRKGDVNTFLANNLAAAQAEGLGLIVGLNILKGGANSTSLTASEIKTFGSVLLANAYPCAFISYQWNDAFFSQAGIKSAMELLSKKANRHAVSSCRR
jgi:hypothetical protein